jgi:23S rRNA pseudouridine1911/1915/1917 synthase
VEEGPRKQAPPRAASAQNKQAPPRAASAQNKQAPPRAASAQNTVVVSEAQHEATLAAVVRELMGNLPWSKARALIESGRVQVGSELQFNPAERVAAGSVVTVNPTARRRIAPVLERERLVHVDRDVVVVRKPAGLVSVPFESRTARAQHPQPQGDSLIERTRQALNEYGHHETDEDGERKPSDRLLVVQRLDKDTTGLLVFARTRAGRKGLQAQFRAHTIERRYVALVHGRAEALVHESFLMPDRGDGLRGSWRGRNPPKSAKKAVTKVRVEQRLQGPWGEATLISCRIETGRQHQIRIHLSEAGNPLIGEQVYDRAGAGKIEAARPMLHAASLGFRHPVNDRPLRFEDPLPDDFHALLERLAQ